MKVICETSSEFATTNAQGATLKNRELFMHKELALLATIVAVFVFVSFGAQAMPASALKAVAKNLDQTTLVAQGCGRYRYRGPRGRCHY
jgi:hypothetical protein